MMLVWAALIALGMAVLIFILYLALMFLFSHHPKTEPISYKMLDIADTLFLGPDDVNNSDKPKKEGK